MESFADVAGMEPWRAVLKQAAATKAPATGAKPKVLDKELGNEVRAPVTQRLGARSATPRSRNIGLPRPARRGRRRSP